MANFLVKTFYKQRAQFNELALNREKNTPFPEGITEEKDIFYSNDNNPCHRMDIFRPKNREDEILPVIIDIHGGGLLLGNKEFNRYFCAELSARGFLVFSVEFSLVPEVLVYDQFSDICTALDYIGQVLPEYKGDKEHIYIVADSGGAYLTTYVTAMQKCKSLAEAAHVTPSRLQVKALGLISGMFYTNKFDEIGICLPNYLYGKSYKKSSFAPYINPEHPDIVTSLPPCYLTTSYNDNLKHYTLNFEKALTKHNIPHELINYPKNPDLPHAFSVFKPLMPESQQLIDNMINFFMKY